MPSLPRISGIYRIFCIVSDKSYVGSSQHIHIRFGSHRRMLQAGKHHSISLQRAWDKYGADAFRFEILEECPVDSLLECERKWFTLLHIDHDTSYNISREPGSPMKGRKHTEGVREKFSATRKGENNANYRGRTLVCPTCGRSFRVIGNQKKYCSHDCYSKAPKSPETLKKWSAAGRGRKRTPLQNELFFLHRAQWYVVTSPEGREYVIQGLARFCREHGLDQGSMSKVHLGKSPSHKGWKCRKQ